MRSHRVAAVTIDFWNTLFDDANSAERRQERQSAFVGELAAAGYEAGVERIDDATAVAFGYFEQQWLGQRRTPAARELVGVVLGELEAELPDAAVERLAEVCELGVLNHPPGLMPGAGAALEQLSATARLALISDTAFSPGRILRRLMEREGVAGYFSAFVFSDETGVAKPEPEAFRRALAALEVEPAVAAHIGDIERTDIAGARAAGMHAILYRNEAHLHALAEDTTNAHAIVTHWDEVEETLARLG